MTSSLAPRGKASSIRPRHALWTGVAVAAAMIGLAGCSGGDTTSAQASTAEPSASSTASAPGPQDSVGNPGPVGGPAVSGLVAAVAGGVAQVQSTSAQTAVSWTAETAVQRTVTADIGAVTVGSCILAIPTNTGGTSSSAASAEVLASVVTVTDPVDGECTQVGAMGFGGFGGQGGPPAGDAGTAQGRPTGIPSGASGGAAGFAAITAGQVTAIDGFTLSVATTGFDGTEGEAVVSVDDGTTYTHTVAGSVDEIAVGLCMTALGSTDDRGALTATSITLSDSVDGACTRVRQRG